MTTKEQERKALEQIRKIVENLGENSYVGSAFEGCFEIAEENISNDFACSMKACKETAESQRDYQYKKNKVLADKIKDYETNLNFTQMERDEVMKQNEALRKRAELAEQHMKLEAERANKGWAKVKAQEEEIIRLKAKLYDLMTK